MMTFNNQQTQLGWRGHPSSTETHILPYLVLTSSRKKKAKKELRMEKEAAEERMQEETRS